MTPRKTTDRETKSLNPHGFHPPQTSVRERIDQLETKESHAECKQWLKETMATRWPQKLPQPFVGFDDNEEAFVLVWESDAQSQDFRQPSLKTRSEPRRRPNSSRRLRPGISPGNTDLVPVQATPRASARTTA